MNMDIYEKFRLWYKEPIECLIAKDEHTGFAVLMLALPILERYLRQRLKITTDGLTDIFYDEMVQMFPALKTSPYAKRFWKCYRNGLLHQATLQLKDGVTIVFVHDSVRTLEVDTAGTTFALSSNKFARRVIEIIENDLPTFENLAGPQPKLPSVATSPAMSHAHKT